MISGGPLESRSSERHRRRSFADLVAEVRAAVEARLVQILDEAVEAAERAGADAVPPLKALRALAMRGGKRFRPVLVAAAHAACEASEESTSNEAVVFAGAAI